MCRPGDQALGHHPGQVDAEPADLAHAGDPGVQRGPQVRGGPRGPHRHRLQRQAAQIQAAHAEEMRVAIPQPRHDGGRADDGRAWASGAPVPRDPNTLITASSKTTIPSGTGTPRPGMRTSASIRCHMPVKLLPSMQLDRTAHHGRNAWKRSPSHRSRPAIATVAVFLCLRRRAGCVDGSETGPNRTWRCARPAEPVAAQLRAPVP